MLRKARVVQVNPGGKSVNLVFLDNGQRVTNVEIAAGAASTAGCSWRVPNVPKPSSETLATTIEHGISCLIALCDTFASTGVPIVVGFSRPWGGVAPSEQDRILEAHDKSGSYWTISPDGSVEVFCASGAYLRIGTGAHQPLAGLLADGKLPSNGPAETTITLESAHGTLTCDPSGNWVLTGPTVTVNGALQVNGSINATGDIVGNNVSLGRHDHPVPDAQSGSETLTTGAPVPGS